MRRPDLLLRTRRAGGVFGSWSEDAWGLPVFAMVPGTLPHDVLVPGGDPWSMWHHFGNERLSVVARAGGGFDLWWPDEGLVRLARSDPGESAVFDVRSAGRRGGVGSRVRYDDGWSTEPDARGTTCSFGIGYARHEVRGRDFQVTRTLWTPFGDLPAVRIDLELAGKGGQRAFDAMDSRAGEGRGPVLEESIVVDPLPMLIGGLMSHRIPPPHGTSLPDRAVWNSVFFAAAASRAGTEAVRSTLARQYRLEGEKLPGLEFPHTAVGRTNTRRGHGPGLARPGGSWVPRFTGRIAVAIVDGPDGSTVDWERTNIGLRIKVRIRTPGDPIGATVTASIVIAVGEKDDLAGIVETARSIDHAADAGRWRSLLRLEAPASPAVAREALWHASSIKGSVMRDRNMGCRFVPQGSAYTYIHGIQGAPRDYAITAIPTTFFDPELARDQIRTILYMTRADGALEYAHTGAGKVTAAVVHPTPSDLPLFSLWCLTDYVWATGDAGFLDREVRSHDGSRSTVADRAIASWRWLEASVGTGPHGLLRVGSGDWSDPISLMVTSRRAFHRIGESTFNSAMATYVLPRAARLLAGHAPDASFSMEEMAASLADALTGCWTGSWFTRGWDGKGRPIGASHLFLDANAWCLIARAGTPAQRETLIEEIARRCDDPSPIGATILDRPHAVRMGALPPGWDCNGGVWAAVNALLAWGYALHDPARAWASLHDQLLAAHATAYPRIWYGIWSGPDAYNSQMGDKAGQTFVQPATPMAEWPVSNSNTHAGPLLAMLKVLGVEAEPEGLRLRPRLPPGAGPIRLETALATFTVDADGRGRIGGRRLEEHHGGRESGR